MTRNPETIVTIGGTMAVHTLLLLFSWRRWQILVFLKTEDGINISMSTLAKS